MPSVSAFLPSGVTSGNRTRDIRLHKPVCWPLHKRHHGAPTGVETVRAHAAFAAFSKDVRKPRTLSAAHPLTPEPFFTELLSTSLLKATGELVAVLL